METHARVVGFPPLVDGRSRVLVLGSMPGRASLGAQAYYAHPRNAFWRIVGERTGVAASAAYDERVRGLLAAGIALWDVAHSCVRPGSLDADIDDATVAPNDLAGLLHARPALRVVCCNGAKAGALWRRHVARHVVDLDLHVCVLPSTSPAHAGMDLAAKARRWVTALRA
jgi:hypoxanthine-DNA glycosylase